jgi:hypothetical protein
MGMEGLGREFNVVPIAAAKIISVKDCAGVEFICTGNDTFTLSSAATYNGSTTALASITHYYTSTATDGSAVWVEHTQAAASTVVIASGTASFYVDCADLPSAAEYLEVTVASAGLVTAILHGLLVARLPASLRVVSGSTS